MNELVLRPAPVWRLPATLMLVIYLSAFIRAPVSGPTWFVVGFRAVALFAAVVATAGLFSKVVVRADGFEFRTWRRQRVPWSDVTGFVGGRRWIRAIRIRGGDVRRLPGRVTLADLDLVAPFDLEAPSR